MSTPTTPEPFNDHTPLPWDDPSTQTLHPDGTKKMSVSVGDFVIGHTVYGGASEQDAAFINHACNTYYEREAEIHRLKGMLSEGSGYMEHEKGCPAIPQPFTTWMGSVSETTMKTGHCNCGLDDLLFLIGGEGKEGVGDPARSSPSDPSGLAVARSAEDGGTGLPATLQAPIAIPTRAELDEFKATLRTIESRYWKAVTALQLIATPVRPDGSWNRERAACQQLAEKTLNEMGEKS